MLRLKTNTLNYTLTYYKQQPRYYYYYFEKT